MNLFRISIVFTLFLLIGCHQSTHKELVNNLPDQLEVSEAQDTANTIKVFYPIGQKVESADWNFDGCHDKVKGYDDMFDCFEKDKQIILKEKENFPASVATKTCSKELESLEQKYIDGRLSYFKDYERWLVANKNHLQPLMINRSLFELNDLDNLGMWHDQEPIDSSETYGITYDVIVGIDCVKQLFECTPPAHGNICWINKVADRLGANFPPHAPWGVVTDKNKNIIK